MKKTKLKEWIVAQADEAAARKELAEAMGISLPRLSAILNSTWEDNVNISPVQMKRAARYTGIPEGEFFNTMPEEMYLEATKVAA